MKNHKVLQRFFSAQPQCSLIFSWIELEILFRCCLMRVSITKVRKCFYILYLWPCLDLQLVTKIIETHYIFMKKSLKYASLAQRYLESPTLVPSLEKLCQAGVARNEQTNLQSILNKRARGTRLAIFVTDCLWNQKKKKIVFRRPRNNFFKKGLFLWGNYLAIFVY